MAFTILGQTPGSARGEGEWRQCPSSFSTREGLRIPGLKDTMSEWSGRNYYVTELLHPITADTKDLCYFFSATPQAIDQ